MPTSAAAKKISVASAPQGGTRLFHARMLVTRLEEWCVEAMSAEEARAMLAAGAGHRCTPGESVHVELAELLEDD